MDVPRRERRLRDAVLAGDEAAWRLWYDETAPRLHAYVVWRLGGSRDGADEVAQDVWLHAVRRVGDFDPRLGPFLAWLRGIAAGLLRNRFRSERRAAKATPPPEGFAEAADAEAMRREQARRVAEALAGLPEQYEAVLRAKYLDGRCVADIAAESGASPKAVESMLSRAREAFRAAYAPE